MTPLTIVWQRLVHDGETCERCGSTQQAILGALDRLKRVLRPMGIEPLLETRELDRQAFEFDPSASNRIWIAGRPMEAWLGGRAGASPCCTVCGDQPCRTLELGGRSFEAIPEDLIVKAALVAAAGLTEPAQPAA